MSCSTILPAPIRDPSGKTYVAIPAPSFVFAQDASKSTNSAPGYVYVRCNSSSPSVSLEDAPVMERTGTVEMKPSISINNWMMNKLSAEPPPGHTPWVGEVLPTSSPSIAASPDVLLAGLSDTTFSSSIVETSSSEISFRITSFDSGGALRNSSLPSTCSSAWSSGVLSPPISEAKAAAKAYRSDFLSSSRPCKPRSFIHAKKEHGKRRYTTCISNSPSRREAHVFNRRVTFEKTHRTTNRHTSVDDQVLSRINKLGDFFSDGLKEMESTMLHLSEEQGKFKPPTPSLVVSTSSAICPVSFESSEDLKAVITPLAQRRGKKTPGPLKIKSGTDLSSTTLEYPDIPTAFRGSPNPMSEIFPEPPKYASLKVDSRMSAERMICNLRKQVENFHPQRRVSSAIPDMFENQCKEAVGWLEDELARSSATTEVPERGFQVEHTPEAKQSSNASHRKPYGFRQKETASLTRILPSPQAQVGNASRVKRPQLSQSTPKSRVQVIQTKVIQLPSDNLKLRNTKAQDLSMAKGKPRKSILSTGSTSSSASHKKVRFSDVSPSLIPQFKNELDDEDNSAKVSPNRMLVTPPKRKPVPSISPIKSPSGRGLPPTPMKLSVVRKPSPLNPASRSMNATPVSHPTSKLVVEPTTPTPIARPRSAAKTPVKKGPLIFSKSPNVKSATDNPVKPKKSARPLSLGANLKENRERSLSDRLATITKRRSYSAGISDLDKENQRGSELASLFNREVQKKSGRRSLPFQSMLSRLRG